METTLQDDFSVASSGIDIYSLPVRRHPRSKTDIQSLVQEEISNTGFGRMIASLVKSIIAKHPANRHWSMAYLARFCSSSQSVYDLSWHFFVFFFFLLLH